MQTDLVPAVAIPYYSFDKLNSYNCKWNFACGMRSMGKTYGCSLDAVKRWIKTGEQFIYLRRTKEELVTKDQFFAAFAHELPDWDFRVVGKTAQMCPADTKDDKKRPWQTCGHFVALTQAQNYKGGNFPLVSTIIFDEFIIEKGYNRYLPGEVQVLTNFYSTVARGRAGVSVKIYLLSNSIEMSNPYFTHYDIDPEDVQQRKNNIATYFNGFVAVHMIDSTEFAKHIDGSPWGKFLRASDPDYAKYAVDNEFADGHNKRVRDKHPREIHMFNIETKKGTFSVWKEPLGNGKWYAQVKLPKAGNTLTMIENNITSEKPLILKNDPISQKLRTAWRTGNMDFDSKHTRNIFMEVFK